jgi:hypothetical protein
MRLMLNHIALEGIIVISKIESKGWVQYYTTVLKYIMQWRRHAYLMNFIQTSRHSKGICILGI